jgi:hypothetical protein
MLAATCHLPPATRHTAEVVASPDWAPDLDRQVPTRDGYNDRMVRPDATPSVLHLQPLLTTATRAKHSSVD